MQTMRNFDKSVLTVVEPLDGNQIREIRESTSLSQSSFATLLNMNKGTVSKWESGKKKPSGPALKLLALIKKHGIDHFV